MIQGAASPQEEESVHQLPSNADPKCFLSLDVDAVSQGLTSEVEPSLYLVGYGVVNSVNSVFCLCRKNSR